MIQPPATVRVVPFLIVMLILSLSALACGLPTTSLTPVAPGASPTSPAQATTGVDTPAPGEPSQNPGDAVFEVTIYLVALEDGGASGPVIGCGDSLVAIQRPVAPTDRPIEAALNELFSIKEQYFGESGLYTALYQSDLAVESVLVDAGGAANVALTGQFMVGGACDTPRFIGQIEQTVLAAPGVSTATILLNGQSLEESLSTR